MRSPPHYNGAEEMDARPILTQVARALQDHGLEAILIGNAAAALQGAPVTTVDLDFLFRKTPHNIGKLKKVAASLNAVILRPYYPASDLFRLMREEDSLQIDFMATIHGLRSFAAVRSRALTVNFEGRQLLVAHLADVIRSKRGRAGHATLQCWRYWRRSWMSRRKPTRRAKLEALRNESERELVEQIRRLLALPPEKRTNFLRKKVGLRGSAI